MDEGRRLDDYALSVIADLPVLEYLVDGSYTEHGVQQLSRLPKLRHLYKEREGLTAPMFRFAAAMPALTRLTGLDEFLDDGPMPPAEAHQVRAMLPHIIVADQPSIAGIRFGQLHRTLPHHRSLRCALSWRNPERGRAVVGYDDSPSA